MDLPFAQKRWCGAANADKIKTYSDHRRASFGKAYGTLIKELRLLTRAMIVVDASGTVKYVEYVPEVTTHPNYDAALAAVKQIAK
jgi:thiol peroxidase